MVSEMDVSRIDPEEALVDFETVEAGDISLDLDDIAQDYGQEDKVLVSIRWVYSITVNIVCYIFVEYDLQTRHMHGTRKAKR